MLVTTTYLEQTSPTDLARAHRPPGDVAVERVPAPDVELSRSMYAAVGADWHWTDRARWSTEQWRQRLSRVGGETWVARVSGDLAGYAELESLVVGGSTEVEVAYFGLLPAYVGRSLGGHLLTVAVEQAWAMGERWPTLPPVSRVWLHTCTLDGPAALPNYQRRGFRVTGSSDAEMHLSPAVSAARTA